MTRRLRAGLPRQTEIVTDVRLTTHGISITVHGDLDLHTAASLEEQLGEAVREGERLIEVHLDDVNSLDSVGLGVLVAARNAQLRAGGTLELVCSQPRPLRVLRSTGVDRVLTVHS